MRSEPPVVASGQVRNEDRQTVDRPLRLFALPLLLIAKPEGANAAEAGVGWHITQRVFPTELVPGSSANASKAVESVPQYFAMIKNTGAGATTGPVSITVTLPEGITADPSAPPVVALLEKGAPSESFEKCETASPNRVVCTIKGSLTSGEKVSVAVPLAVAGSVSAPATASVAVTGGGAPTASDPLVIAVGAQQPVFEFLPGLPGLAGEADAASGLDSGLAGTHPFSILLEGNFSTRKGGSFVYPVEAPKDIEFRLPRGLVANPQAPTKLCTEAELITLTEGEVGKFGCPYAAQVGEIAITTLVGGIVPVLLPLYDMQPPPGVPAEFGFNILGTVVHIQGGLDGAFHLTAGSSEILAKYPVLGIQAYLWGNPADPAHDATRRGRGGCGHAGCALEPGEANTVPFLTMPTSCGEALDLDASASTWEGGKTEAESAFLDEAGSPLEMAGCNALAFEPTIESTATTNVGDSPSGLEFSIHQPQDESLEGRATAALKDARVTLPEGMTLNASAANGLGSCTEEQMGYAPEGPKVQFATAPQSCPNAAKVGTLEVTTPHSRSKIPQVLPGSIYVARPFANPFGSLLAIYLAVEDEESGIVAKLAGKVEPDPQTGQADRDLHRKSASYRSKTSNCTSSTARRATLTTPLTCGTQTTTSTLTPWSTPEGVDAHPTASFQTTAGCSASEAAAPKDG